MNEQELIDILTNIDTENAAIDSDFISILAKNLLLETEQRPLPNASLLKNNPDAVNILKKILLNSHEQYADKQINKIPIISLLTDILSGLSMVLLKRMVKSDAKVLNQIISDFKDKFTDSNRDLLEKNDGKSVCELLEAILKIDQNSINSQNLNTLIHEVGELQEKISLSMKTVLINEELSLKLMVISLRIHSEQFFKEFTEKTGPYHIIHFYESPSSPPSTTAIERNVFGVPRASEFACGYNSDDSDHDSISMITNITHGIGSGIYGRMRLNEEDLKLTKDVYESYFKIITLKNPLILDDTNSISSSINSEEALPRTGGFNEEERKNSNATDNQTSNSKQGYQICSDSSNDFWLDAFGIAQEQVSELLISSLSPDVNRLLQPVVKEALLTNDFFAFLVDKSHIEKDSSTESIEKQLSHYSQKESIITAYIKYDFIENNNRDSRRKHAAAVLQAIAHIKNIELHIWERSNFEDGRLQPYTVNECEYHAVDDTDNVPQKRNYHVYKPNQPQKRLDFISCGILLKKIQLVGFGDVAFPIISNDPVIREIDQQEHSEDDFIEKENTVYSIISNELQKIADEAKKIQLTTRTTQKITRIKALEKVDNIDRRIENIAKYLSQFSAIKSQKPNLKITDLNRMVNQSLISFLNQARQGIIKMPINFLIHDELHFDGVICEQFDTFRNGLVAFTFEPEISRSPSPHACRSFSFFDRTSQSKSNSNHRDSSSSSSNSPYGGVQ